MILPNPPTTWDLRSPRFTNEWRRPTHRYQHPRHWHWLRIWTAIFWLAVLAAVIDMTVNR